MAETRPYVAGIAGSIVGILLFLAALGLAALEMGTASVRTPPGPDVAAGSINGAGYVLHRWPTGRSVFLWHDLPTAVMGHGIGSTREEAYTYAGQAGADDGPTFDWEARTTDGRTIVLRIANETWTLVEDAVFFVCAGFAGTEVRRVGRDLTEFATNHQGAVAMVSAEPAVAEFVAAAQRQTAAAQPVAQHRVCAPDGPRWGPR